MLGNRHLIGRLKATAPEPRGQQKLGHVRCAAGILAQPGTQLRQACGQLLGLLLLGKRVATRGQVP